MYKFLSVFSVKTAVALVGAAAFLAGPALHAANLAEVVGGTGQVEWVPTASAGNGYYTLTVEVPGEGLFVYDFDGGAIPYYPVDNSDPFPDGLYTYELARNPAPHAAGNPGGGKPNAGEEDENGRPLNSLPAHGGGDQGLKQSGSFTVADGSVVDPDLAE